MLAAKKHMQILASMSEDATKVLLEGANPVGTLEQRLKDFAWSQRSKLNVSWFAVQAEFIYLQNTEPRTLRKGVPLMHYRLPGLTALWLDKARWARFLAGPTVWRVLVPPENRDELPGQYLVRSEVPPAPGDNLGLKLYMYHEDPPWVPDEMLKVMWPCSRVPPHEFAQVALGAVADQALFIVLPEYSTMVASKPSNN